MSVKRISLAALAFCAVFSVGLAQDGPPQGPGGPGGRHGQRGPGQGHRFMQADWSELKSSLNLTDDQVAKLKAAIKTHMEEMRKLREDSAPGERDMDGMKSARDSFQREIKGILNSDQYSKLDDMGGPRRLLGGPPSPMEMLSKLGLTDEQKNKARTIFAEERKSMEALRNDASADRQDRRDKMMSIHRDTMKNLKAVLTDDQFSKLQEMMRQHRPGMRGGRGPGGRGPNGFGHRDGGQGGPGGAQGGPGGPGGSDDGPGGPPPGGPDDGGDN